MNQTTYSDTTEEAYSITDFKQEYGDYFENLSEREKLFLIKRLGYQLCQETPGSVRTSELVTTLKKLEQLPKEDRLNLIRELSHE
jgi:hypothetical protein